MNMKARIPPAKKPCLPAISETGAYDADDLRRYFREAKAAAMMDVEIARHLRVEVHRAVYFAGVASRGCAEADVATAPSAPARWPVAGQVAYGGKVALVVAALRRGEHAAEIADRLGWKNPATVYAYAARQGIPMSNGRAVLS